MKRIRNIFYFLFVCRGKHISEPHVTETKDHIFSYHCKMCNCTLGLGYYKHLKIYPPGSNQEDKDRYDKFIEEKENNLRKGNDEC